jgi:hypothetical protein
MFMTSPHEFMENSLLLKVSVVPSESLSALTLISSSNFVQFPSDTFHVEDDPRSEIEDGHFGQLGHVYHAKNSFLPESLVMSGLAGAFTWLIVSV